MATTSLTLWGVTPAHLHPSEGRRVLVAMRPKFSTYKTRLWAMMLKHSEDEIDISRRAIGG
jgi:hypothetical protein